MRARKKCELYQVISIHNCEFAKIANYISQWASSEPVVSCGDLGEEVLSRQTPSKGTPRAGYRPAGRSGCESQDHFLSVASLTVAKKLKEKGLILKCNENQL